MHPAFEFESEEPTQRPQARVQEQRAHLAQSEVPVLLLALTLIEAERKSKRLQEVDHRLGIEVEVHRPIQEAEQLSDPPDLPILLVRYRH